MYVLANRPARLTPGKRESPLGWFLKLPHSRAGVTSLGFSPEGFFMRDLDIDIARSLIHYDHSSGIAAWKVRDRSLFRRNQDYLSWNTKFAWSCVGGMPRPDGYLGTKIFNVPYMVHRIVWAMYHGENTGYEIDHVNGDRSDNRITNLRAVHSSVNSRNKCRHRNNSSGVAGVHWSLDANKWRVSIGVSGEKVNLGLFTSLDDAAAARLAADIKYGYHSTHGSLR